METNRMGGLVRLTRNEVNNLIFALLKYGYGHIVSRFANPSNAFIAQIMQEVYSDKDGINIPVIINNTMRMVEKHYSIHLSRPDFDRFKAWCYHVTAAVMRQPFEVRDDLGEDAENSDFEIIN